MKRLLIILTLMVTLLVPGLAQATQFIFGGVFDDENTLSENLTAAVGSEVFASAFSNIEPKAIDAALKYTFTGIGYSQKSYNAGLSISVGQTTVGSTDIGFDLTPEYSADELTLHFTDYAQKNSGDKLLSDLLLSEYVQEAYVLTQNLTISTGDGVYNFVAGTIFISFIIPDKDWLLNGVDFILALSPSAVPVPAAAWLLGSGLAGVLALRRKLR